MENTKIKSFADLNAWKQGHLLILNIYKITKKFPQEERYGLISQMQRAAVSITSNIAEGFSRNTNKDKFQFYCMAHGSLTELQNQLIISRDLKYLDKIKFDSIAQQTIVVGKLINGLKKIKYDKA